MKAIALFLLVCCVGYLAFHQKQERARITAEQESIPVLRMSSEASAALAQVTPSKVVLFSTAWCPYCAQVKKLLDKRGVRFTELDVEKDPRNSKFQEDYMLVRGFPVLVVGTQVIGGYNEPAILAALKEL